MKIPLACASLSVLGSATAAPVLLDDRFELPPGFHIYRAAEPELHARIAPSISGRELTDRGFAEDVTLACELDASQAAPRLEDRAYVA